jgi:CelD/BcsL family acetyltransferase involved in cellulose biosynthesis
MLAVDDVPLKMPIASDLDDSANGNRLMDFQVVRAEDLSQADLATWRSIVSGNDQFVSPFFHPDYTMILSEYRPNLEVAVLREREKAVGFFSFERHARTIGRPLGIRLADFQGVVVENGVSVCFDEVLRGAGLSACHFDHLLADQSPARQTFDTADSHFIDLSEGYKEYLSKRQAAGSGLIAQTLRKQRKLEREVGPITFRWRDTDPKAVELLWEWKEAQRRRTGTANILTYDWVRSFLNRIGQTEQNGVSGVVSTLRVNNKIIAVHLGMHTAKALHYWFPAYATDLGRYSPGSILLLRLAKECAVLGITRIDLGKGDERYKSSFASGSTSIATGVADCNNARHLMRLSLYRIASWTKTSPLWPVAKVPKRLLRLWQARHLMRVR